CAREGGLIMRYFEFW
nr:immunoglobulin heavy chain junction region [Macaca mulatta]MOW87655.1 immunoglobulin heavy chain junction region [Macaca mulatta]MOW88263.1 immunoglobulin heavy chain junction region [Macaca mulatta]MOW88704.1 immunoglobulin heavy chain junction region [Macaca mulatta]MOW88899.1 immunoglobulin heavy chain junction region [Macaca mulatta]